MSRRTSLSGSHGGAANEAGSSFRAAVAVYFLAHAMRGRAIKEELCDLELTVPSGLILPEGDQHVDDLLIHGAPRSLCIQAKSSLVFSAPPNTSLGRSGSGGTNEFSKTVLQLVNQTRDGEFDPKNTRLVVAVGKRTAPLVALQHALVRERSAVTGKLSPAEEDALRRFDEHLVQLDSTERRRVHEATTLLFFDGIEQPGRPAQIAARNLLEGVVIAPDQVELALDALKHLVREKAARRLGSNLDEWMRLLRERNVSILPDPAGPLACRLEATRLAVVSYRSAIQRAGSTVQIASVSLDVVPDTASLAVAAGPRPPAPYMPVARTPLAWAARLHRRVILTGLPGSGKSAALRRYAAELAFNSDGPIPLIVHLPDLFATGVRAENSLEVLVRLALQRRPSGDQELLGEAVLEQLRRGGRAALLLDSLDECFGLRKKAIRFVADALEECHDDVEMVLATRHAGLGDATALELAQVHLIRPGDLCSNLGQLARKLAPAMSAEEACALAEQAVAFKLPGLDSPPLPALLAGALVQNLIVRGVTYAGTSKAAILSDLVDNATLNWDVRLERLMGTHILRALPGAEAAKVALSRGFSLIGWELLGAESNAREALEAALSRMFEVDAGLPSIPARGAAREVLRFWDDAACYEWSEHSPVVRPRSRMLAEVGAARYLVQLDPAELAATLVNASPTDIDEVLSIAAGLSPKCADIVVDVLLARQTRPSARLVLRLREEGVAFDLDRLNLVVDIMLNAEFDDEVALICDFKAICALDVEAGWKRDVLQQLESLIPPAGQPDAKIMKAVAVGDPLPLDVVESLLAGWQSGLDDYYEDHARTQEDEHSPFMFFRSKPPAPPVDWSFKADFRGLAITEHLQDLIARHIPADNVALAQRFYEHCDESTQGIALKTILRERGLVGAAPGQPKGNGPSMSLPMAEPDHLGVLAGLTTAGQMCDLTHREKRAFLDLVTVVTGWKSAVSLAPGRLSSLDPAATATLGRAICSFVGANVAKVAAQAVRFKRLTGAIADPWRLFGVGPSPAPPPVASRASALELVDMLGHDHHALAEAARDLLRHYKAARPVATELLVVAEDAELATRHRLRALFAVAPCLSLSRARRWGHGSDVVLQRFGLYCLAYAYESGQRAVSLDDIMPGLVSSDLATRQAIQHQLRHLVRDPEPDELLREAMRLSESDSPPTWLCVMCKLENDSTSSRCYSCETKGIW